MSALTPTAIVADIASYPIRHIGDDLAIFISDAEILVSSKSEQNSFRLVDLLAGTCSCPAGAHGLPSCHHRTTAKIVAELDRREAVAVLPEPMDPGYRCFRCGVALPDAKHFDAECAACIRERQIAERGMCPKCNKRPRAMLNAKVLATCNCCLTALD
jgi:hypothetical protein